MIILYLYPLQNGIEYSIQYKSTSVYRLVLNDFPSRNNQTNLIFHYCDTNNIC